jgi:DNA-binding GntR family transcriptional regulator
MAEQRLSASEMVLRALQDEISDGTLLPGDALDEDALAKRFAVSRTPVREALLQLSARGLVLITPRVGIHVARLSIPELMSLAELLAELEGACAKLATRRMTADVRVALQRVHEQSAECERTLDAQAYGRSNAEFHELIYGACRNPALADEIAHIRRRTRVYRQSAFQSAARIRRSRQEHGRILEAMLAGDETVAGQLMTEHIAIGGRDFTDFISTAPQQLLASDMDAYPGKLAAERRGSNATPPESPPAAPVPSTATRRRRLSKAK